MIPETWLVWSALAIGCAQAGIVGVLVARNAWIEWRLRRLGSRSQLLAAIFDEMGAADSAMIRRELGRREILADLKLLEGWLDLVVANGRDPAVLTGGEYEAAGLVPRYLDALTRERRWARRAAAAEILGWTGSPGAVPALLGTALDTVGEPAAVRAVALRSLQRIRHPDAVQPLVDALATSETWFLPRAASVLVKIGAPAVAPLVRELAAGRPASNRRWAAYVLGEIGDHRALRPLHEALDDVDPELRSRAAKALGLLRHPSSAGPLLDRLLTDPSAFVRTSVARALGQLPTRETVEFLTRSLSDPEWWVRLRAVESLANLGSPARDALRGALHDRDPGVAREAARGLERMGTVAEALESLRRDGYTPEVAELLHDIGKAGSLEGLLDGLHDPDPAVVLQIVRALGRIGDRACGSALAELLARATEPSMQARAIEALQRVGARGFDRQVESHLAAADEWVRRAALGYLEELGDRKHPPDVRPLLADPDPGVRRAALRLVQRVRPANVDGALLAPALRDEDPGVRAVACAALAATGRHDLLLASGVPGLDDLAVGALVHGMSGGVGPESLELALALLDRAPAAGLERLADVVRDVARRWPAEVGARLDGRADVPARWASAVAAGTAAPAPEEEVARWLDDPDPRVRAAAIPVASTERVLRLAGDGSALVAVAAVRALLRAPGPRIDAGIAAAGDALAAVAPDAALALALRGALHGGAADRLATGAGPECRVALVAGRLFQGEPGSLDAWIDVLKDEDLMEIPRAWRREGHPLFRELQLRAATAGAPHPARLLTADGPFAAEAMLLGELDSAPDARIRLTCLSGLRRLESRRADGVMLGVCLMDPSPAVRTAALEFLVARGRLPQTVGILEHALRDPDESVRVLAARRTAELDAGEAIPLLLRHIDTHRPRFLDAVTDALAARSDEHGPRILRSILARPAAERPLRALATILAKRRAGVPPQAVELLLTHPWAGVRAHALARLAPRLGAEGAERGLAALRDPSAGVRVTALRLVTAPGNPLGVDPAARRDAVLGALSDPSARVRHRAVRAAAEWEVAAAREALRPLTADSDARVARAAVRARAHLTARPRRRAAS